MMDIESRMNEIFERIKGKDIAPLAVFQGMRGIVNDLTKAQDELRAYKEAAEKQKPLGYASDTTIRRMRTNGYRCANICNSQSNNFSLPVFIKPAPTDKPAVAVPKNFQDAIVVLRENLRDKDRGVKACGIRDNDQVRDALNTLLSAPSHSQQSDRSPKDFAIEYAEYMAVSGEQLMDYLNDIANEDEGVLVPDDRYGDYVGGLQSGIYEFRKRRDRCPSHESALRISKKDVQEIVESFSKWINLDDSSSAITTWDATYEGRELLEKLNAGRRPSHESEQGGAV